MPIALTLEMPYEMLNQAIYTRLLCMELRKRGIELELLLREAGIGYDSIHSNGGWISFSQFLSLCNAAQAACPDPRLPLDWGMRVTENVHGFAGMAVTSAPNLREALKTLQQVVVLRNTTARVEVVSKQNTVQLEFSVPLPSGALADFIYPQLALSVGHILRVLLGEKIILLNIKLPIATPAWSDISSQYFPCSLSFSSDRLAFCIPAELLDLTNPHSQPSTYAAALRECELERLGLHKEMSARVSAYLANCVTSAPTAEEAAAAFFVSSRSLRRALAKAGTSYRVLLHEERMALACRYLESTGLTVDQIACELGYAETTNFIRSFRKLNGCTPLQHRRNKAQPRLK